MSDMDRLVTHAFTNPKYLLGGKVVDDGAAMLVRRFGLSVRINTYEDIERTKLMRVGADVLDWMVVDRRQTRVCNCLRMAGDLIAEGYSFGYIFSVLARGEYVKECTEIQQVFSTVERYLSGVYDPQTNKRRYDPLPFISI